MLACGCHKSISVVERGKGMRVVFLGLMYADAFFEDMKKKNKKSPQMAPHNFQSALLAGMRMTGNQIQVVNIPPVGSFPINYRSPFVPGGTWGEVNSQIGYFNVPFLKHHIQEKALKREIEKIMKRSEEDVHFVAYSPYLPFLRVLKKVKKKYPNTKCCLIVTDCIPGRGDMEKYMTSRMKRRGDEVVKLTKSVDAFALVTEHLVGALELENKPYVLTECVCNASQMRCQKNPQSFNRCLYTGGLSFEYGIKEMVEAFAGIKNAELWLCGDGPDKAYVEQAARQYPNVKYYGFLPSELLQPLRQQCDFMINPRRPTGTYTKYSFPSKTVEYMMTGKPVIMYKLEGVQDEYDPYLNYLCAQSSDEMRMELEKIFSADYNGFAEKGMRGRDFVMKNKDPKTQAEKIISLLR